VRAHHCLKGYLTSALKEIRRTKGDCVLQWHAEKGNKNILFTDEKTSPSWSSTTAGMTRFMLKHPMM
jgi:hypothetical protein